MKCIFALILVLIIFKHPKNRIRKNCVDMHARVVGGDRNLLVRKGGTSQKKIGKHWNTACLLYTNLTTAGFTIAMLWVPSHKGIVGNEIVNSLAKLSTTDDPQSPHTDTQTKIIRKHVTILRHVPAPLRHLRESLERLLRSVFQWYWLQKSIPHRLRQLIQWVRLPWTF